MVRISRPPMSTSPASTTQGHSSRSASRAADGDDPSAATGEVVRCAAGHDEIDRGRHARQCNLGSGGQSAAESEHRQPHPTAGSGAWLIRHPPGRRQFGETRVDGQQAGRIVPDLATTQRRDAAEPEERPLSLRRRHHSDQVDPVERLPQRRTEPGPAVVHVVADQVQPHPPRPVLLEQFGQRHAERRRRRLDRDRSLGRLSRHGEHQPIRGGRHRHQAPIHDRDGDLGPPLGGESRDETAARLTRRPPYDLLTNPTGGERLDDLGRASGPIESGQTTTRMRGILPSILAG